VTDLPEHGETTYVDRRTNRPVFVTGVGEPGKNLDRIDVVVGLQELTKCGYVEPETKMVIEYALIRWARGEEAAAERGATDRSFHGIDLTSWYRVVAAARAAGERNAQ
jgi:hypothetical protein